MTISLEDLLAERTIYRHLVAFAQAMDERNWSAFDDFTSENVSANLGRGVITGRATVVEFIRSFLDNCGTTQHMLGNVIVDVDGNSAKSSAYVCDMHLGLGDDSNHTFHTLGQYRDTWEKIDGRWLMVHRVKDNRGWVGSLDIFSPETHLDADYE